MGKKNRKHRSQSKAVTLQHVEHCLPTREFLSKHPVEKIKTDLGKALRVQDKRPIDKYHRLYCIDRERGVGESYRRGINDEQFSAANKIANNYERSNPKTGMRLDAVRVQTSISMGMYPVETIVNAIHFHTRMMKDLNRLSQDIVESVCCREGSLFAYEKAKAWRKGYGMIRLREALDELYEAFKHHDQSRYK